MKRYRVPNNDAKAEVLAVYMPKATPSAKVDADLVSGEALQVLMTQPTRMFCGDDSGSDS